MTESENKILERKNKLIEAYKEALEKYCPVELYEEASLFVIDYGNTEAQQALINHMRNRKGMSL